jgi:UDP-GlcNAc:undecaprenyl-phosphate/decaprenyl-phosphate GlcNAc-1-phosphate transferase
VGDHLVVGLVAAGVTAVMAFPVTALARRLRAVGWRAGEGPDSGEPAVPVPTLGGLAMFAGLVAAIAVAASRPTFSELFSATSEPVAVLVGATLVVLLGVLDDLLDLSAALKLAGQLAAATVVATLGLQLQYVWVPRIGVIALSADLGLVLTVIFLVSFINVVNLVDGLDGLASSVVAIGASSFFLYVIGTGGAAGALLTGATLLAVVTVGLSAGFLLHNWYPARLFMGDTGSMLLGMLLGASGVAYVGRSAVPTTADFFASVPLIVPLVVLAVPVIDTTFVILRRLIRDQPVTRSDLGHLHHLLVAAGHSHRRAVLVLSAWSATAAFALVGPVHLPGGTVAAVLLIVVLALTGFTLAGQDPADEPHEPHEPHEAHEAHRR